MSGGSVSTQTTVLERIGFLERLTFPGDRATYYQLRPNVWVELMKGESERLRQMKKLAEAGREVVPHERPDRVEDLDRVASFFLDEWPDTMKRLMKYLEEERS